MARISFTLGEIMSGNIDSEISVLKDYNYHKKFNTDPIIEEDLFGYESYFFNPNCNVPVYSMVLSGSNLYLGGDFTTVSGSTRNRLAAVNKDTGALLPFDPNCNNIIYSMVISGSNLYFGGYFTNVSGSTRNRIAAVHKDTGALLPFDPNCNNIIYSMALSGSNLYIGGDFTTVSGSTRNRIAAINKDTGALLPFNPNCSSTVYSITMPSNNPFIDGDFNIYLGGSFTTVSGSTRNRVAVVNKDTGALFAFNPNCNSTVYSLNFIEINGFPSVFLYLGGDFTSVGGITRNGIAAINKLNGVLLPFNPNCNDTVRSMIVTGSNVYLGGIFTNVSGSTRNRIAAVHKDTGALLPFDPNCNFAVRSMLISGSNLYLGGQFTGVSGLTRNYIAVVNKDTGALFSVDNQYKKFDYENILKRNTDKLLFLNNNINQTSLRENLILLDRNNNNWQLAQSQDGYDKSYIQALNNSKNFTLPVRNKIDNLLINRFSSPGEPKTMSAGNLDVESGEYSVYNNINHRNSSIRDYFNRLLQKVSTFGGYQSGSE